MYKDSSNRNTAEEEKKNTKNTEERKKENRGQGDLTAPFRDIHVLTNGLLRFLSRSLDICSDLLSGEQWAPSLIWEDTFSNRPARFSPASRSLPWCPALSSD